jgi:FKBP-type peptidyl-prolyl cis-trans isomerase 2
MRKKLTMSILILAILLGIALYNNPFTTLQDGDIVGVRYTGTLDNGTIFDTNIQAIAQQNDLHKPNYDLLVFTIGQQQVIPGFEKTVKRMKQGQTKTVKIQPENAYGTYDDTRITEVERRRIIPREVALKRIQSTSIENFRFEYSKSPVIGETVHSDNAVFPNTILSFDEKIVTLRADPTIGEVIQLPDVAWSSTVLAINEKTITVRQDPDTSKDIESSLGPVDIIVFEDLIHMVLRAEIGDEFQTPAGPAKIKDIQDLTIYVDLNHPLAGQTLEFEITLESIKSN